MIDIILLPSILRGLCWAVLAFIALSLAMIPIILAAALVARGAIAVLAWLAEAHR